MYNDKVNGYSSYEDLNEVQKSYPEPQPGTGVHYLSTIFRTIDEFLHAEVPIENESLEDLLK